MKYLQGIVISLFISATLFWHWLYTTFGQEAQRKDSLQKYEITQVNTWYVWEPVQLIINTVDQNWTVSQSEELISSSSMAVESDKVEFSSEWLLIWQVWDSRPITEEVTFYVSWNHTVELINFLDESITWSITLNIQEKPFTKHPTLNSKQYTVSKKSIIGLFETQIVRKQVFNRFLAFEQYIAWDTTKAKDALDSIYTLAYESLLAWTIDHVDTRYIHNSLCDIITLFALPSQTCEELVVNSSDATFNNTWSSDTKDRVQLLFDVILITILWFSAVWIVSSIYFTRRLIWRYKVRKNSKLHATKIDEL